MNPNTNYTRIQFARPDLFDVCCVGLVAQRIGTDQCTGWVLTDRLPQLTVPYQIQ